MAARHPAAFINVIAEDGTKAEAIKYLQDTWDDYMEAKLRIAALEREIETQKKREMKAKCTRCGHSLFSTADQSASDT